MIKIKKDVVKSPIRDLLKIAKEVSAKGMKLYPFNIGDPNKFDFDTPQFLKDELIKVVNNKAGYYADSQGDIELRRSIVEREKRKNGIDINEDDVVITHGISEGMIFLFSSLIDSKKDEVLLPGPAYPPYIEWVNFFGGKVVTYKTDENNQWQPDLDDLRKKISKNTKLLTIINPNNPTGAVYEEKTVKEMVDIATENNLPVLTDDIYDELVFGDIKYKDTPSLAKDVPLIGFNGFSKSYLLPGWRLGYIYFYDPRGELDKLKKIVISLAINRLSASTPIMRACAKAYSNTSHVKEINRKLKERAEFAYKRLNEIEGISAVKPRGAFYIFPKINLSNRWKDDEEFCIDLLKHTGIIFPYGSGFDPVYGKDHFRSVILPPVELMEEAFDKLEKFMKASY